MACSLLILHGSNWWLLCPLQVELPCVVVSCSVLLLLFFTFVMSSSSVARSRRGAIRRRSRFSFLAHDLGLFPIPFTFLYFFKICMFFGRVNFFFCLLCTSFSLFSVARSHLSFRWFHSYSSTALRWIYMLSSSSCVWLVVFPSLILFYLSVR